MAGDRQPQEQEEEEEEEEEDFTFPLIAGNSPCSIDSPPWLYSPSNPTSLEGGRDEDTESRVKEEEAQEKKEKGVGGVVVDTSIRDGSREEKMDMLWEDFNEELWGSSTTKEKRHSPSGGSHGIGCGKFTGLSKGSNKGGGGGGGGGALSSPAKRPSAVAFVKALRKLFLLRGGVAPGPIKTRRHR